MWTLQANADVSSDLVTHASVDEPGRVGSVCPCLHCEDPDLCAFVDLEATLQSRDCDFLFRLAWNAHLVETERRRGVEVNLD